MSAPIKRREFITLLGGAAAAPVLAPHVTRAQQPVIGFLHPATADGGAPVVAEFRKGLSEAGFVEGRNVTIEYRWAQNDNNRLAELAAELVRRKVAVIATPGSAPAAVAAKAATTSIPIVFGIGSDPVAIGLVKSLNRPGGNVTGITSLNNELASKRIGYLHALAPSRGRIGVLINPSVPYFQSAIEEARIGASAVGRQIEILPTSSFGDIDSAFAKLLERPAPALLVNPGWPAGERRAEIATLAARHAVPVMYPSRQYVQAGGLISYGPDTADEWRQTGIYTGRVLKGEKPSELPVWRAIKFELVINLHTAKALGLTVPPTLLSIADEVIE